MLLILAQILLPIFIGGGYHQTESRTFTVTDASGVDRLFVTGYSLGYKYGDGGRLSKGMTPPTTAGDDHKASLQLNNGPWIPVTSSQVTCTDGSARVGCIGSGWHTVTFTMPVTGVRQGENTIRFRFGGSDGITVGYRILSFNLLRRGGARVLPETAFRHVVPTYKAHPQAQVNRGLQIWHTRQIGELGSPLAVHDSKVVEQPLRTIQATCSDCHGNGYDLKYHHMEPEAIRARSMWHGLSAQEAEDVIAYISSLNVPDCPGARPWSPPFQPAPGIDSRSPECWSAGGGVEAVVEDRVTGGILVRSGDLSSDATLNMRELPVAIQFPDWNEWLPEVHPKDAWPTFTEHAAYKEFLAVEKLANGNASEAQIRAALDRWGSAIKAFPRKWTGLTQEQGTNQAASLMKWYAVMQWNLHQRRPALLTAASRVYPRGEARSWLGSSRNVFDIGPHIIRTGNDRRFPYGSEQNFSYMTDAWYQLQIVINPGQRSGGHIKPVDWKYSFQFTRNAWLMLAIYLKHLQETDNNKPLSSAGGFYMRHAIPTWLEKKALIERMPPDERRQLMDIALTSFTNRLRETSPDDWPRQQGKEGIEPATYDPASGGGAITRDTYASQFWRILPTFNTWGVRSDVLASLAEWLKQAWPLGNWTSRYTVRPFRPYGVTFPNYTPGVPPPVQPVPVEPSPVEPEPPDSINVFTLKVAAGWSIVSLPVVPLDLSLEHILPGAILVKDDQGRVYHPELGINQIGEWSAGQAYQVYATEPFTVEVRGLSAEGVTVPLRQGWNLVPYLRTDRRPVREVLRDVVLVKDQEGRVYHPALGINQIGRMEAGRGYMVYSEEEGVVTY